MARKRRLSQSFLVRDSLWLKWLARYLQNSMGYQIQKVYGRYNIKESSLFSLSIEHLGSPVAMCRVEKVSVNL